MAQDISRRNFMRSSSAMALGAALFHQSTAQAGPLKGRMKKSVSYGVLKEKLSIEDKFKVMIDCGFEGVEPSYGQKVDPKEMRAASDATGLQIHGVSLGSVNGIEDAVDRALLYGSDSVLLVAGRVNEKMPYAQNYTETQAAIRKAIPYAEKKKVLLLVENVWNNFLLSPLEMAQYIDELESEWVAAYFDIGNVARFGWPEHWIPVLGARIKKLHIKGYSRKKQMEEGPWAGFKVKIGEGDIDYAAVQKELAAINYTGWINAEVPGGDRKELAAISERLDKCFGL
jgi:L-ribulose-5-phosphate 3-epimerase